MHRVTKLLYHVDRRHQDERLILNDKDMRFCGHRWAAITRLLLGCRRGLLALHPLQGNPVLLRVVQDMADFAGQRLARVGFG